MIRMHFILLLVYNQNNFFGATPRLNLLITIISKLILLARSKHVSAVFFLYLYNEKKIVYLTKFSCLYFFGEYMYLSEI